MVTLSSKKCSLIYNGTLPISLIWCIATSIIRWSKDPSLLCCGKSNLLGAFISSRRNGWVFPFCWKKNQIFRGSDASNMNAKIPQRGKLIQTKLKGIERNSSLSGVLEHFVPQNIKSNGREISRWIYLVNVNSVFQIERVKKFTKYLNFFELMMRIFENNNSVWIKFFWINNGCLKRPPIIV